MPPLTELRDCDPRLLPYLRADSDLGRRRELERLIAEQAEPVIRGILRRNAEGLDFDDLRGDVLAQLLLKLDELARQPGSAPIRDFRAYVAVTTYRARDAQLRSKYPRRARVKNRLRLLLTDERGFGVWRTPAGLAATGFRAWDGRGDLESRRMEAFRADPAETFRRAAPKDDPRRMNPADLLGALFDWTGHPIELDDLVGIVAELWDERDSPVLSTNRDDEDGAADLLDSTPDQHTNVASEVEMRDYLARLWSEVRELPPNQAAALLLNLCDRRGRGVLALFPILGIAGAAEMAAALGMEPLAFAALWRKLPLDDLSIAAHLGITRQQVINLRKSARERLSRRMRPFE